MTTVGAYEAKTHLARLLDEVAAGATVKITKHGREVAHLVPVGAPAGTAQDVATALREARRGVSRGDDQVVDMKAEGRR
ncbi:MAG: type II toxin-antitoxin system prevent-host-death family antitoxin [Actinomycetia bacterium]|nr:type II toxin-antitoxin system prevent-host-death family antitoxin [Actinomycetes bacterium]